MEKILIKKRELEPAAAALAAWLQCVRLGLLSSRIGMVKGIIGTLAEGVYHDRNALIDDHAIWDEKVEPSGTTYARRMKEYTRNGEKVAEEVVFKDPRAFQKDINEMMSQEIEVEVPFLFTEQDIKDSEKAPPKDAKNLPVVDFGALLCLFRDTARHAPQQD